MNSLQDTENSSNLFPFGLAIGLISQALLPNLLEVMVSGGVLSGGDWSYREILTTD